MDTELERREAQEDEAQAREQAADRRAEMAPGPRVLRTPRDEVHAHIGDAAQFLAEIRSAPAGAVGRNIAAALQELDRARVVLESPNVIDGAGLFAAKVTDAADALEEGDYVRVFALLAEMRELLHRQVRYPDAEVPIDTSDFESDGTAQEAKRSAVRAVLLAHSLELGYIDARLRDEVLDAVIAAAETGI